MQPCASGSLGRGSGGHIGGGRGGGRNGGLLAGARRAGRAVRFRDFLRVAVVLFGGAATALAVVSVAGAAGEDTNTLVYVAAIWWCLATLAGLWIGQARLHPGIAGASRARPTPFPSWSRARCCSTGSGR